MNKHCSVTIECPFCAEKDFDLVGLKGHLLNGDCEEFNHTETPFEERMSKARANVEAKCVDCDRPRNDLNFHFDAPGANYAAGLHWYKEPSNGNT